MNNKIPIKYLKLIIRDVKFLYDIFIYPYSLFRYVFRRNKKKYRSKELGNHWQINLRNGIDWRVGKDGKNKFIKYDNEYYIRNFLKESSKKYNTILDIGSYDGYYFNDYSNFKKIVCADMFAESKECIEKKFKNKFEFVLLNGKNFSNIESNSIDFVFSMYSLQRVPKITLITYFKEINRITTKNSFVFLQIPDCFYYFSLNKNYTFVSGRKLQNHLFSFDTKLDYQISIFSPIIIGKKN